MSASTSGCAQRSMRTAMPTYALLHAQFDDTWRLAPNAASVPVTLKASRCAGLSTLPVQGICLVPSSPALDVFRCRQRCGRWSGPLALRSEWAGTSQNLGEQLFRRFRDNLGFSRHVRRFLASLKRANEGLHRSRCLLVRRHWIIAAVEWASHAGSIACVDYQQLNSPS